MRDMCRRKWAPRIASDCSTCQARPGGATRGPAPTPPVRPGTRRLDLNAPGRRPRRPGVGDDARAVSPKISGESAAFMTYNRNKRSVTLDLKAAAGRTIALALAARADVVLENFRPGATARLGLGYDHVRAINPRVIYCSISGFGQTGPYRERGGFDRIAQGMSGFMSISGDLDGPPLPLPIPIADIGTGMFAT